MCYLEEAWEVYATSKDFSENNFKKEYNRYNFRLKNYWKNTNLQDIKTVDIIKFRKHLTESQLSPQSVKHCLTLLRGIMRRALVFELYSGKLPLFEMPKIDNKRIRYLTEDEASLLLNTLYDHNELWHDITLLALNTGLRASEIFSIRKSSINISIQDLIIFESKNSSIRTIPLNATAFQIIEKYYKLDLPFFFSSNKIEYVSQIFSDSVKKTNLNEHVNDRRNKIVFHSLRHTFASWLVQRGVSLMVLSQLLGHKDLKMTMRYAHLAPDQGKCAVDLIPNNISPCVLSR